MSMNLGGGGKDSLKADINVTPLVDVMLVLLIIMMLIAPMLRQGVPVQMPEAANTGEKPDTQGQTVVAIDSRGAFYVNLLPVQPDNLIPQVQRVLEDKKEQIVYLKGDKDASTWRSWTSWTRSGRRRSRTSRSSPRRNKSRAAPERPSNAARAQTPRPGRSRHRLDPARQCGQERDGQKWSDQKPRVRRHSLRCVSTVRLKGHIALVTGANHGIGAATARTLASGDAAVVLNYLAPLRLDDEGVQLPSDHAGF